ncbi:MAG TPA: metallophosphoesterase [Candidatus Thermoplasmatota archaeon]|nr:metallophosphoesterase [Candidatus Thermoplasmatota archaeon]
MPPSGSFEGELALPSGASAPVFWLERGSATCDLGQAAQGAGRSRAWPDMPALQVTFYRFEVPATCPPGLYDLHLHYSRTVSAATGDTVERQVNAVKVMDPARYAALADGSAQPRFVVLADPQIGDPRAFQQAAQEDPTRIPAILDGTIGDGSESHDGLWKAVHHALDEARALDPDFVLVAGDLAFSQLVPGSYAVEYEEIWRVLTEANVPLLAAPGNHDGYVANGQDGFAYWRAYLGPTYTLAPTVPGTYVLVLNTYDWSELDRLGLSYAVSAWGGQVRADQLAWADDALATLRAAEPGARVLALSHHSPSWRQDPFVANAQGVPGAEQAERGAITFAGPDQGWMGENRLELRDLLRERGVEILFAGHTHHDRVARDDGAGQIVGTTQTVKAMPAGFDPRLLHYWARDDTILSGYTQEALAELVRSADGPLYVDTTTTMSESDQYWGYRPVQLAYDADGHLDLTRLGHPLTQEELDALALHPERYNVAHAELGLFSTPLRLTVGAPWDALS